MKSCGSRRGNVLDAVLQLALRHLRAAARRPVLLTFSLVQPLLWMSLFGFLFERATDPQLLQGVSYLSFVAPGIGLLSVLFGASQSGVSLIRDMQTGLLGRALSTRTSAATFLAGKLLADVLRVSLQAMLVLLLGVLLGAKLGLGVRSLPLALLAVSSFALLLSSLSCCLAAWARAPELMGAYVHLVNMPLLFTSTALIPGRHMPDWLAALARFNPVSLTVEALRSLCLGFAAPSLLGVTAQAGAALLAFWIASRALERAARLE